MELNLDPLIAQRLVEEVALSLRPLAEAKGLRFDVAMPTADLVIQTDRRALSQILINLVNNAIKFTETGSVRLELGQHQQEGWRQTEISVVDTGIGIRPEDQTQLVSSLCASRCAHQTPPRGHRAGLHLSQKLAQLLGGYITFQSEYSKGSTFTLVLKEQ